MMPNPKDYHTADEFLSALEKYGRSIGAKPLGPLGMGRLCAKVDEAKFWDWICDFGRTIPPIDNATIETQLRAAFDNHKKTRS